MKGDTILSRIASAKGQGNPGLSPYARSSEGEVLRVENVTKVFHPPGLHKSVVSRPAVSEVTLGITEAQTYGLVGESGSGKSTLARMMVRLTDPTSGYIELLGSDITKMARRELRPLRKNIQIVFQDPSSSLDPSKTILQSLMEPLNIHKLGSPHNREKRVCELLEMVGLSPDDRQHYPHEFSGGQRQRISIARALAVEPKITASPSTSRILLINSRICACTVTSRAVVGSSAINNRGLLAIAIANSTL